MARYVRFPRELHTALLRFYQAAVALEPDQDLLQALAADIERRLRAKKAKQPGTKQRNAAARRRMHCRILHVMTGKEAWAYVRKHHLRWRTVREWDEWGELGLRMPVLREPRSRYSPVVGSGDGP